MTLHDFGFDGILPEAWASPTSEGLKFTALTLRQADRLVQVLEDVAAGRQPEVLAPGAGQFRLF